MHRPRKRFGQHFLCDQGIIQRIIEAIAPKRSDHLIEIGPGQGALTVPMLRLTSKLEAIELDRDLIAELTARTQRCGDLIIHNEDALEFDFAAVRTDDRPLRVFGNLPYNISTPLIFHVLDYAPLIADMVFMLQKEVAERLTASPGTADYGRLSVMVQYRCQVDLLFHVSPQAFYPPPEVQSSIVRLIPYTTLPFPACDEALFAHVVKQAFNQRRKTLRNSLKNVVDEAVWADIAVQSTRRPEDLSVSEFVKIANVLAERKSV